MNRYKYFFGGDGDGRFISELLSDEHMSALIERQNRVNEYRSLGPDYWFITISHPDSKKPKVSFGIAIVLNSIAFFLYYSFAYFISYRIFRKQQSTQFSTDKSVRIMK